jgi:AcrR family transcriptional regulator
LRGPAGALSKDDAEARLDQLREGLRKDPKEELIRAADHVLEKIGPQAATVRVITSMAEMNTSAINYHFQSREKLLTEVGRRRMDVHNETISARLAELESTGRPLSVEEVFRPLVEIAFGVWAKDPVLRALRKMVLIEPRAVQDLSESQTSQIYHRMFKSLVAACPHLTPAEIEWRYELSLRAIVTEVMRADAGGGRLPADPVAVEHVITFVAAAFRPAA